MNFYDSQDSCMTGKTDIGFIIFFTYFWQFNHFQLFLDVNLEISIETYTYE